MNIQTDKSVMIYKHENQWGVNYSVALQNKKQGGSYETGFIPIRFKKDVELENKTLIKIKNGFLSFYKDKEGKTIFYPFVLEFEKVEDKKDAFQTFSEEINIQESDLPF